MSRTQPNDGGFGLDYEKQYQRCMIDTPEMIEFKKDPNLTPDEIAELKCKPFACRIQMCMSMPKRDKGIHKDVFTGKIYRFNDPCINAHSDFLECVEKEKKNILSSIGK